MDAGALRSEESQDMLAELASSPYITVVASVDHILSNRMWSTQQCDKYSFYMMKVDTYRPYINEYMNSSDLFAIKNDNQEVGL